ncbi:hypothetical protein EC973_000850 [Apophysomyces ossiformis]|uniref:Uncharacterized protein n=1 Tax=Apophysomyces ossiformis TaxID=679940 RepID=A0A8H7ENK2_9FUNG|nr:hypothetical protein EC973_000850 [Apophysomyces ossiformis]
MAVERRNVLQPKDKDGVNKQLVKDLIRRTAAKAGKEITTVTAKPLLYSVVASMKEAMEADVPNSSFVPWCLVPASIRGMGYDLLKEKLVPESIPLNACVRFWGARLMIAKHWNNKFDKERPADGNYAVNCSDMLHEAAIDLDDYDLSSLGSPPVNPAAPEETSESEEAPCLPAAGKRRINRSGRSQRTKN